MGPIPSSTLKNTITERQANVNFKKKEYFKSYNNLNVHQDVQHRPHMQLCRAHEDANVNTIRKEEPCQQSRRKATHKPGKNAKDET